LHCRAGDGLNPLVEFPLGNAQPPFLWKLEIPGSLDLDGLTYVYPMLAADVRDMIFVFNYKVK